MTKSIREKIRGVLKPLYCIYGKMDCQICSAICGITQALKEINVDLDCELHCYSDIRLVADVLNSVIDYLMNKENEAQDE